MSSWMSARLLTLPVLGLIASGLGLLIFISVYVRARAGKRAPLELGALFFFSGFSALVYEVVWQRILLRAVGVQSISVSIVTALFMFGLGTGAGVGGWAARRWPDRLLTWFIGCELVIAGFGVGSGPFLGRLKPGDPFSVATTLLYLAVPVFLMGSTLPVLVADLARRLGSIPAGMRFYYALNTFGGAAGSWVVTNVLLRWAGLHQLTLLAASINVLVATGTALWIRTSARTLSTNYDAQDGAAVAKSTGRFEAQAPPDHAGLSNGEASGFAFLSGVLTLSQVILWNRYLGFASAGIPYVFGSVLAAFLAGTALGTWRQTRSTTPTRARISRLWALAAVLGFLAPPLLARTFAFSLTGSLALALGVIFLYGLWGGAVFPLLIDRFKSPALIYGSNILGSTIGPLLLTFVAFRVAKTETVALGLGLTGMLAAAVAGRSRKANAVLTAASVGCILIFPFLYQDLFERMELKKYFRLPTSYEQVVQNEHGILTVRRDPAYPDSPLVAGNGAYDGFMIPTLRENLEGNHPLHVPLLPLAVHAKPEEVLQIGMSGGTWTRVLAMSPAIKKITVIELNPGYVEIAATRPAPQIPIELHFLDARRWLADHPERKFDIILMSTPHHWRKFSSNLLSVEFFETIKRHLKPQGRAILCLTGSEDALFTLAHVFPYATSFEQFGIGGTDATVVPEALRRAALEGIRENGQPVFVSDRARRALRRLSTENFANRRDEILADPERMLVTEDNLLTEFKRPKSFISWLF